jgi:hypothetical protein
MDPAVREREVSLPQDPVTSMTTLFGIRNACLLSQNAAQRVRDRERRKDPAVREREVCLPVL